MRRKHRGGIGAEAEKGGMPEADQTAIPDQQVEAHGHDRIDQDAGGMRDQVGAVEERQRAHDGDEEDGGAGAEETDHAVPKRPCGRQISTAAISA